MIKFTKMHGTGNNYIYVDGVDQSLPTELMDNLEANIVEMSRHNYGIGSDGLILIEKSGIADFKMRIFNADGSEAKMCGNGIRCVGKYVYEKGHTNKTNVSIESMTGVKYLELMVEDGTVKMVRVDMGEPILEADRIPVIADSAEGSFVKLPIMTSEGILEFTCVSMGNPHAVSFGCEMPDVETIGPQIEHNIVFPDRVNASFVVVKSKDRVRMRVWERGSGITQACGTGACAVVVAAILNGLTDRKVAVELPGGDLEIEWDEKTNRVFMTGPAVTVYSGEWINK